jgi:hypothetical protein
MPSQLLSEANSACILLLPVGLAVLLLIAVVAILRAVNAGRSTPNDVPAGLLGICGMGAQCLLLSV